MYHDNCLVFRFISIPHHLLNRYNSFDPHFNAITGLNGSGKSNILDSICFVLGITNLSQVRAGNLSELVYKQGQAGINKASVTIVFNNSDTANSPVGYDHCSEIAVTRQISIGGKSKYLINGKVSPANQVANLFHSVQLNVNNPHFLIMQGRITKVLNMKPDEILGMVEEAAGTRMYENKKVAALKTIEKKQKKVDEINAILQEEITPTLERLRGEKENYLKWSKNKADIERIERFVVASEYMRAKEALVKNDHEINEMEERLNTKQSEADEYWKRVEEKEKEMEEFSERLNGEFGKAHKELKSAEEKLSKELVKVTSAWQNSVNNVSKARDDLESAKELVKETESAASLKQSEIQNDSAMISKSKDAAAQAETELERLTMEYQNMCAGISSQESGEGMTLPDQISKAHSDANIADAKAKQAEMKINHLQKSIKVSYTDLLSIGLLRSFAIHSSLTLMLKSVETDMKKEEKSSAKLSEKKKKAVENVESMKSTLSSISFSPDEYSALENEKIELENTVGNLQEVVDTLTAQLEGRLAFNYSDPVRGFDRNKVKGVVAKLIRVKNPTHATALEVVAGGKLFQVVVDEAITGKALLSRGKLQRRVTIIPLDKIHSKRISNANVTEARSIAQKMKSSASPAIELVGFDEEVRSAIEYVFGSTLVVDDSQAANKICDLIKTRTVTLDGDIYDPSGTISGGSKDNIGTTLSKLTELTSSMEALAEQKERLSTVTKRLSELKSASKKYEDCAAKLELYEAELSSIEKHLSQTTYGMLHEKFSKMKKEIEDAVTEAKDMKEEKQKKWDLYNELKEKEADLTRDREEKLKETENRVKQAKKTLTELVQNARVVSFHLTLYNLSFCSF
jgi:structural maintenance of chromosome 2